MFFKVFESIPVNDELELFFFFEQNCLEQYVPPFFFWIKNIRVSGHIMFTLQTKWRPNHT